MDRIQTHITPGNSQDVIDVDAFISAESPTRPGPHRRERLQICRSAITEWRSRTWSENYSDCAWGPNVLISDAIINKLATRSHISTVEDIKQEILDWDFADDYGSVVLELIRKSDEDWKEDHARKLQTNKDVRKRQSLENKEHRKERRTKKRAETAQRTAERAWVNAFAHPPVAPLPFYPSSYPPSMPVPSYIFPQPIFFVPGYPPMLPHAQAAHSQPLVPGLAMTQNQPRV
jgi:hypothetical protein